jgi:hypothetical protein
VIVRDLGDRVQLITQPDHAHLAERIMRHCAALAGHARRADILAAVAEHDNGWIEEDAVPQRDPQTGAVMDFVTAPLAVRHAVWPRGVARLAARPWTAALVAQHAIAVYDRFRSTPAWQSFFARMEAARDEMLHASGGAMGDLLADYVFVRLGDLVSLSFCTGWPEAHTFERWTVQLAGTRVLVRPGILDVPEVPIEIEARWISAQPAASEGEWSQLLIQATRQTLRGSVAGAAD